MESRICRSTSSPEWAGVAWAPSFVLHIDRRTNALKGVPVSRSRATNKVSSLLARTYSGQGRVVVKAPSGVSVFATSAIVEIGAFVISS